MKVTSQQPAASNQSGKVPGADQFGTPEPVPSSGPKSFANVLDSVGTPAEHRSGERGNEGAPVRKADSSNRKSDDQAEMEEPLSEVATLPLPPVVSTLSPELGEELLTAREILGPRDLDQIVLTVKTLPGQQTQAVIDLPHSVLQGLRVKLSEDTHGRINAEFIVRNEGAKSQIEGRASDLVDMLRFRGVHLAALKTSVGTELSFGDSDHKQRFGARPRPLEPAARSDSAAQSSPAIDDDDLDSDGKSLTYRA